MATSAASMRPHSICKIDDLDEREEDVASVPGGSVAAAAHPDLSEWYIHTVVTSVSIERGSFQFESQSTRSRIHSVV